MHVHDYKTPDVLEQAVWSRDRNSASTSRSRPRGAPRALCSHARGAWCLPQGADRRAGNALTNRLPPVIRFTALASWRSATRWLGWPTRPQARRGASDDLVGAVRDRPGDIAVSPTSTFPGRLVRDLEEGRPVHARYRSLPVLRRDLIAPHEIPPRGHTALLSPLGTCARGAVGVIPTCSSGARDDRVIRRRRMAYVPRSATRSRSTSSPTCGRSAASGVTALASAVRRGPSRGRARVARPPAPAGRGRRRGPRAADRSADQQRLVIRK